MKRIKLLEKIGFRYILNHKSKEIHKVRSLKRSCNVNAMRKAGYHTHISQFIARSLFGYNGCVHCNKRFDKG